VRIAFIGASYATLNDNGATRTTDIVARIEDHGRLAAAVKKAQTISDLVVVTMHAGVEYVRKPNAGQVDFAHAAIDAGADIVIGAHPHWIQVTEWYKDRPIFYSLGNFIFDQRDAETKKGLVLRVSTVLGETAERAKIDQIELIPIMIDGVTPRKANPAETASILKSIGLDETIMKGRP
jgi:poly-gamma-glutamate capsule biosynthesis protein CapA/YwtB (metallophosphatase superfamily)